MYYHHDFFSPWIVFAIIMAVIWAFSPMRRMRMMGRRGHGWWGEHQSARSILAERFAKGEITEEQFKKAIEALKEDK